MREAGWRAAVLVSEPDEGTAFTIYLPRMDAGPRIDAGVKLQQEAASVASEIVKRDLEHAVQAGLLDRVAIVKRGAKYFVVAALALILHERNGQSFLNKLKPEVAVSKATEVRLGNCATIALEWYIEAMRELIDGGTEVSTLVRSQESWSKVAQRILSKWRVYSLAKNVVEDALPVL
jgi:hypothetical protein